MEEILGEQFSFRIVDNSEGAAKRLGERIGLFSSVDSPPVGSGPDSSEIVPKGRLLKSPQDIENR